MDTPMRMRKNFVLGCVMWMMILSPTLGSAQENPIASKPTVESGDYKPLTVWSSISLGTSYYTNPTKAEAINVAYSFNGPKFSADLKDKDALWNLAKQGKISFGMGDKKKTTITVVPFSELQKSFPMKEPSDLVSILAKNDISVVSYNKVLLGTASSAPVVKTASSPTK